MRFAFSLFLLLLVSWACIKKPPEQSPKTFCSLNDLPGNLQDGIVTYYPFCNNTNDAGGKNNGTLTGGNFVSDRSGNPKSALALTSDSSIVCSSNLYDGAQIFTISVWLKTTSIDYGRVIVFDESQCDHVNDWDRTIFINEGQAGFYVFPGSIQNISGGPNISDDKWHHLAATLDTDGMKLYVDGNLVASHSAVTSAQSFSGFWRIGSFQKTTPVGSYDDVIIYNRALSSSEIRQLYQL